MNWNFVWSCKDEIKRIINNKY